MTTDDVMREFTRSVPYIDGVAETHYLDANAMAAEIVRLRACVERVRGIGVSVRECAPRANDGQMELWLAQIAADILTALEES